MTTINIIFSYLNNITLPKTVIFYCYFCSVHVQKYRNFSIHVPIRNKQKMLYFLLISSYSTIQYTCTAPLKHADKVPNGILQQYFVITRHGFRAPMDKLFNKPEEKGTWICDQHNSNAPRMRVSQLNGIKRRYRQTINTKLSDFPPNCASADLLTSGSIQHIQLGNFYRTYLIDELNFLPENFNSSQTEFRSTKFSRCQKSSQSFVNGFYPAQKPNEKIQFYVGSDKQEFLYPDPSTCKELKDYWPVFTSSQEYQKRMFEAQTKYKDLYDYLNMSFDNETWLYWGDLFSAFYCSNNTLPKVVTDQIFNDAVDDNFFMIREFYSGQKGVAASPLWREVFEKYEETKNGKSSVKFHLYSAHDTTIYGVMSSVGYNSPSHPPYRSHLGIEIWKVDGKDYVRLVFNGVPVEFVDVEKGKTLVEISVLKEKLSPYLNYCLP